MLVLSRKAGERIVIGDRITVVVSRIAGGRVTLAIQAPGQMKIIRGELQRFTEAFQKEEVREAVAQVVLSPNTEEEPVGFTPHAARLPR